MPVRRPAGDRSPSRSTGPGPTACAGSPTDAGITVIAGMFTPAGDGRVTNTLIAAGPGRPNQPDTHYDKIHLYDAFGFTESRTVAPGREPVVITVDGIGVGLSVCYDIRFPGALHRAGPARRPADRRLRVLGFGPRQTRAVDAAGPGPGAGLDELRRRGRSGRSRATAAGPARARRRGWAAAWWPRRSARWSRRPARIRNWWSPTSTSTGWPRPATASRCCVTTPSLLRSIGQNRSGDEPTRTTERGPVDVGPSRQSRSLRPASHRAPDRAHQHRRPGPAPPPAPAPVARADRAVRRPARPTRSGPATHLRPSRPRARRRSWPLPTKAGTGEEKTTLPSRPAVHPADLHHRGRASDRRG